MIKKLMNSHPYIALVTFILTYIFCILVLPLICLFMLRNDLLVMVGMFCFMVVGLIFSQFKFKTPKCGHAMLFIFVFVFLVTKFNWEVALDIVAAYALADMVPLSLRMIATHIFSWVKLGNPIRFGDPEFYNDEANADKVKIFEYLAPKDMYNLIRNKES